MTYLCVSSYSKKFTEGVEYEVHNPLKEWPWMLMAVDNNGVGRYIHGGDMGKFTRVDN